MARFLENHTNRAPRQSFPSISMKRRQSLPIFLLGCVSFIRDNSKDSRREYRLTWSGGRLNPSTGESAFSMRVSCTYFPSFDVVNGNSWNVLPHGRAMDRATALSPSLGIVPKGGSCLFLSTIPLIKDNVMCVSHSPNWTASDGNCRICSATLFMSARVTICVFMGFTWMCPHGITTFSNFRMQPRRPEKSWPLLLKLCGFTAKVSR